MLVIEQPILKYVWIAFSRDYDDIEILGVYSTPEKAMEPYKAGWKQQKHDDGLISYIREHGSKGYQYDMITRYEVT